MWVSIPPPQDWETSMLMVYMPSFELLAHKEQTIWTCLSSYLHTTFAMLLR